MPTHDPSPELTAQVAAAVADLDRSLRRLKIAPSDRRAVVDDVRSDLERAAEDGVPPETLIGRDVDAFAREAIEESGCRPRPGDHRVAALAVNGTVAAAGAVAVAFAVVVLLLQPLLAQTFTLDRHYPTAGPVVAYAAIAVLGLVGTLAALHQLLAGRAAARETLTRAALLVPIAAAAGVSGAVSVWRRPDYAITEQVVVGQLLLVVVPVSLALVAARWWGLRTVRTHEHEAGRAAA